MVRFQYQSLAEPVTVPAAGSVAATFSGIGTMSASVDSPVLMDHWYQQFSVPVRFKRSAYDTKTSFVTVVSLAPNLTVAPSQVDTGLGFTRSHNIQYQEIAAPVFVPAIVTMGWFTPFSNAIQGPPTMVADQ